MRDPAGRASHEPGAAGWSAGQLTALAAARAQDPSALADALVALPETERRALETPLHQATRGALGRPVSERPPEAVRTAQVAVFGTSLSGTFQDPLWDLAWVQPHPRLAEVLAARPTGVVAGIVRALASGQAGLLWFVAHDAVRAGRAPRPDGPGYHAGLVAALPGLPAWPEPPVEAARRQVVERLRDRPELVEELWQALRLEEVLHDLAYWRGDAWVGHLAAAAEAGVLERDRLLDETLGGQVRDLRPSSAAFFRKAFDALDPAPGEVAARAPALVRVLGAGRPAEQREAARRLRQALKQGAVLDALAVCAAAGAALTGDQKGTGVEVVRLLADLPAPAAERNRALLAALGHPHPDVQAAALSVLEAAAAEAGGLDAGTRLDAPSFLETVSTRHQARLAALVGGDVAAPDAAEAAAARADPGAAAARAGPGAADLAALVARVDRLPPAVVAGLGLREAAAGAAEGRMPPPARPDPHRVRAARPVAPMADAVELAEVLAAVMARSGDGLDLERAVDGMARVDPARLDRGAGAALEKMAEAERNAIGNSGIGSAVVAWCRRRRLPRPAYLRANRSLLNRHPPVLHDLVAPPPHPWSTAFDRGSDPDGLPGFLAARLYEAVEIALDGPRPTLALPTWAEGWLEADDLAERLARVERDRRPVGRFEAVQALLRVRPPGAVGGPAPAPPAALAGLRSPVAAALRRLCGDASAPVADPGLLRAVAPPAACWPRAVVARPQPGRPGSPPPVVLRFEPAASAGADPARPAGHDPAGPRRDDPAGDLEQGLAASGVARPRVGPAHAGPTILASDELLADWVLRALPRHRHLLEAWAAVDAAISVDAAWSTRGLDVVVAAGTDPDVPLGWPAHLLLAVALGARSEPAGAAATDVLAQAAVDGRLDPHLLGGLLAEGTAAGVVRPARVARRAEAVARLSPLAADRLATALARWLALVDDLPRDVHAVLEVLHLACTTAGRGLDDEAARAAVAAGATGTSKRARAASALLELAGAGDPSVPVAALEQLVARGERWAAGGGPPA